MAKKILIVDDEKSIRDSLAGILSDEGFDPIAVESAEDAFSILADEKIALVLLDIWMPAMDGMTALPRFKELYPRLPVIMISGHGTIETAVKATRMGAYDFIEKPPSYDKIILAINNALHLSDLEQENIILKELTPNRPAFSGGSQAINGLQNQLKVVAPTEAWVLIRGEHGTGKELAAHMIHQLSSTADRPMVEVNCAAIPEELIESELFGHEKGAFTGANEDKTGKFDQADGSILFLDEIGDMSLKAQAKVLRILQEQKFERVGGSKTLQVNVRVLAATNKDLENEIEAGNFRADLYWRLNVVPVYLPPLRDRLEDLPELLHDLTRSFADKGLGRKEFAPDAMEILQGHNWPGNVRELRNLVERLTIMVPQPVITAEIMTAFLPAVAGAKKHDSKKTTLDPLLSGGNFKDARKSFEKDFIEAKLQENNGNISRTAEHIGMERSHLHKKIKNLGIEH